MPTPSPYRHAAMLCLCLCLCLFWLAAGVLPAHAAKGAGQDMVVYTAITTTTPQLPLLGAVADGWPTGRAVRVEYWKTMDDLRALVLAGKGDIWIGNLESFALAAMRGAPVTLVAVTGWKKFFVLAPKDEPAATLADLAAALRTRGQTLAVAPPDSPAVGMLGAIARHGGPSFTHTLLSPQQLMLEAVRGTRRAVLLPEPLVSTLLAKQPNLRVVASIEEEYATVTGGPARLPIAGVAVHAELAARDPAFARGLAAALEEQARRLAADPTNARALALLPEPVVAAVGRDALAASLGRDMILALPAAAVREEIRAFLHMALGSATNNDTAARLDALLDGPFLLPGEK